MKQSKQLHDGKAIIRIGTFLIKTCSLLCTPSGNINLLKREWLILGILPASLRFRSDIFWFRSNAAGSVPVVRDLRPHGPRFATVTETGPLVERWGAGSTGRLKSTHQERGNGGILGWVLVMVELEANVRVRVKLGVRGGAMART